MSSNEVIFNPREVNSLVQGQSVSSTVSSVTSTKDAQTTPQSTPPAIPVVPISLKQSSESPDVTVAPNNAPDASDDVLTSMNEDSGDRIITMSSLLSNDSAGLGDEGQTLTITAVTNVIGGTAEIVGSNIIFHPEVNFHGDASFDYVVEDDAADPLSAVGNVTFNVEAGPAPAFTPGNDTVNFNAPANSYVNYIGGTQYDALGGDDVITLPNTAVLGFDFGHVFEAGEGDDTVFASSSFGLTIDGGDHTLIGDTINYANVTGAGVIVDLSSLPNGTATGITGSSKEGVTDVLMNIENVVGSNFNDILTGNAVHNILNGAAGNDFLTGDAGDDSLVGGTGSDTYLYNNLDGSTDLGTDTLIDLASGGTADLIDFSGSTVNVALNLATIGTGSAVAVATGLSFIMDADTAANIENITTGSGNDTLTGNSSDNILIGGSGTDTLSGGGGNDTLEGDAGNDTLSGGTGNDTLIGGSGNDTLTGGSDNDTYVFSLDGTVGLLGTDTVVEAASGGIDTLDFSETTDAVNLIINLSATMTAISVGTGLALTLSTASRGSIENLTGGAGNDTLTGNALDNTLKGGSGNDILTGAAGNDNLIGGIGNDTYVFDADSVIGTDTVTESSNILAGGIDTFDFSLTTTTVNITLDLGLGTATISPENLILNFAGNSIENAIGGSGADSLTGSSEANILTGNAGADTLIGLAGDDTLTGGAGNDSLIGGSDNDTYVFDMDSNIGTDTVTELSGEGNDTFDFSLTTSAFNINANLSLGTATFSTGNLNLNPFGADVIENIIGGAGADTLTGSSVANILTGNAGNDRLEGLGQNDTLTGGIGNDTYVFNVFNGANLGTDTIVEAVGGGTDTMDFSSSSENITLDLSGEVLSSSPVAGANLSLILTPDSAAAMDNITGGSGIDHLTGNDLANILIGGGGNDTLIGLGENDTLTGGAGNDSLVGGIGNDTYVFDVDSAIGTDTVTELVGEGNDTFDFSLTTSVINITANLGSGTATFSSANLILNPFGADTIENITGGSGNDILTGSSVNNVLTGGAGNDTLIGLQGDDTLTGGRGNDTYVFNVTTGASFGTDTIVEVASGGGTDLIDFSGSSVNVILDLSAAVLSSSPVAGGDLSLILTAASAGAIENMTGGSGDDTLTGNALANILIGGSGNDNLFGGAQNDTLTGGAGNDSLVGGSGNDTYTFNMNSAIGTDSVIEDANISLGGVDTFDFSLTTSAINITANLSSGSATFSSPNLILNPFGADTIENITGGSGNDSLTGSAANNILIGGTGNDTLMGLKGDDTLTGGTGNDTYVFNVTSGALLGTDTIVEVASGGGTDLIDFSGSSANIMLDLSAAVNFAVGGGDLSLILTAASAGAIENMTGGSGDDTLTGNRLANTLVGGRGNDTLTGGTGNDVYSYNVFSGALLGTDTIVEATGGGTDLIDFSTSSVDINLNLSAAVASAVGGGDLSLILTSVSAGAIENMTGGSGNDTLIGNALANVLIGGIGSDSLEGGALNDTLTGGVGDDTYVFTVDGIVGLGTDTINENALEGIDTLNFSGSSVSLTVNLTTLGTIAAGATGLVLSATSAANIENAIAGAGNDTLTGNAANNVLTGGSGNDTYIFDMDSAIGIDKVVENADSLVGGIDTLNFSSTTSLIDIIANLGSGIVTFSSSNLTLNLENTVGGVGANTIENITGGSGNDSLTGSNTANTLIGGIGNDTLIGLGGDDSLTGGLGNDTYAFNLNGASLGTDTITEAASGGTDTLDFSSTTLAKDITLNLTTIGTGLPVDIVLGVPGLLQLVMSSTTAANIENLTGGAGGDTLTGNALANTLIGGAGNDTLAGAAGNDIYGFDLDDGILGVDTIVEAAGAGTETLDFSATTAIAAASNVNINLTTIGTNLPVSVASGLSLILTAVSAAAIENLTGGSGNDTLTGNALANTLIGGIGNDTLTGAGGNDIYAFDLDGTSLGTDIIVEGAAGGTETLDFSSTTSPTIGVTVDLTSIGTALLVPVDIALGSPGLLQLAMSVATAANIENLTGGAGDDTLTGNTANNVLIGGAGNDRLTGGGGNDTLTGGAGDDTYVFHVNGTALGSDTITEAASGGTSDTIDFSTSTLAVSLNLSTIGGAGATSVGVGTNLSLTLTAASANAIENLIGGTLGDTLVGNAANNTLTGGMGADNLTGGAGSDIFKYNATNELISNVIGDTVNGFTSGSDQFQFARASFNGDSNEDGNLDTSIQQGAGAQNSNTANTYFVLDTTVGAEKLFYDADADGAGLGVLVANLNAPANSPAIVSTDIHFF